jgi:hypothetical protein
LRECGLAYLSRTADENHFLFHILPDTLRQVPFYISIVHK